MLTAQIAASALTTVVKSETYTYDVFNRLTSFSDGATSSAYTYKADGLRLTKTVNGIKTTHVWDGSNIVMELDGSGNILDKYIRGINLNIDPWGLDSYIYCDAAGANHNNYAVMKKELESYYGTPCHIIPISSVNDVITGWDGMDANGIVIDTVVFDFHAWSGGFQFTDANGNSIGNFGTQDISSLKQQSFKQLILLGCNIGRDDPNNPNSIFTEQFLLQQSGIEMVVAGHGFTVGTVEKKTSGFLWWKKTTEYYARWVTNANDPDAQGYKVFARDPQNSNNTINTVFAKPNVKIKGMDKMINDANAAYKKLIK